MLGGPNTLGAALGGEERDNLEAIKAYVSGLRPLTPKYPGLLAAIQDFESWYLSVKDDWYISQAQVDEATRRKFAINAIMGQKIPDTWVVAHGSQVPPPVPPPGVLDRILDAKAPDLVPTWLKWTIVLGVGGFVLFQVRPLISAVGAAAKRRATT